ncbi:sugar ABC transporter substrate-binding protein [Leifsonia poae]|uniref:sugar ABC transporter substrate-binding protein n=1 Tax=Leifsonia poae TaxID=110933 RepID=UPI001CBFC7C1|nr:sugar ABC transporter substrate-binding protein [Leifsonia poae]
MSQRTSHPVRTVAAAVMASAALIALAGCNAITNGSTADTPSTGGALRSILFVNPLPNYSQWKLIGTCMGEEAQKKGVKFSQVGPSGSSVDANYMVSRYQQGIANGEGAIATFPLSAEQFSPLIDQAKKKGILTATLFGGGSTSDQDVEVGTDYATSATQAVDFISKNAGSEQVKVGLIVGAATPPPKVWSDAFIAAADKTDNVKVVDTGIDNGDPTKDVDLAVNMLTAHPEITMFATNEGAASAGISAAIKQKGLVGKVHFVGNGADESGVQALKDGTAASVLMQDLCGAGEATTDALIALHEGKKVEPTIGVDIVYATKDTYKKYLDGGRYL